MYRIVRAAAVLVIGSLFALSVAAATVAQQQVTDVVSVPQTAGFANQNLVAIIAGFASLLATHFFQFWRETRNRKWDLQDRASAREEMRKHAETQRIETYQTAVELAKVSSANKELLLEAIDLNTKLTADAGSKAEQAYVAANDFSVRIEALQKELARVAAAKKKE